MTAVVKHPDFVFCQEEIGFGDIRSLPKKQAIYLQKLLSEDPLLLPPKSLLESFAENTTKTTVPPIPTKVPQTSSTYAPNPTMAPTTKTMTAEQPVQEERKAVIHVDFYTSLTLNGLRLLQASNMNVLDDGGDILEAIEFSLKDIWAPAAQASGSRLHAVKISFSAVSRAQGGQRPLHHRRRQQEESIEVDIFSSIHRNCFRLDCTEQQVNTISATVLDEYAKVLTASVGSGELTTVLRAEGERRNVTALNDASAQNQGNELCCILDRVTVRVFDNDGGDDSGLHETSSMTGLRWALGLCNGVIFVNILAFILQMGFY